MARALTTAAYRAGARWVDVAISDARIRKALIAEGPEESLDWTPRLLARLEDLAERQGATILITGDAEPDLLADLDQERVAKARMLELEAHARADLRPKARLGDRRLPEPWLGGGSVRGA